MQLDPVKTVYVVVVDDNKDMSDARRFGRLRAVFSRAYKPYNTPKLITAARKALAEFQPGDFLLMVGDPALGALCMSLIVEKHGVVDTLQWDRMRFEYVPQRWDFDAHLQESTDFDLAEDDRL